MKLNHTWVWVLLALGLFGFIYFFHPHPRQPGPDTPSRLLAEVDTNAIKAVQVRPGSPGQLAIRAERSGEGWRLTEPLLYPALGTNVVRLIQDLVSIVPASFITPDELRSHPNPDQEYGFTSPHASIIVQQGDYRAHLIVGALTAPGDQVYLQVVGREGVYVCDAAWLKDLPKTANDWRDTVLLTADVRLFDKIAITNNSRALILQRDTQNLWRMSWPLASARADNLRIQEGLERLKLLKIRQFVSDDPKADLESYGLTTAGLDLSLSQGTNAPFLLEFGKTVQGSNQVYARIGGHPSIFTVDEAPLAPWRPSSINDFRDPRLVTLTEPLKAITVRSDETFLFERDQTNTWRVLPWGFPADLELLDGLVSTLTGLQVAQFTKDVVNSPDWPQYGLTTPLLQYSLQSAATNAGTVTNCVIAELSFGSVTNEPDKIFVRRSDETSVYAITTNDFAKLRVSPWQFRDRQFWDFSETNVTGVIIRQNGKTWELVHKGPHQWSIAPGFFGIVKNDLAVEETVRGLARMPAVSWVARNPQDRERFGFKEPGYEIEMKLNDGRRPVIQFGAETPSNNRYAAVKLDGDLWVMELSWILYRDISSYLSIP